jgi:hypothetical protein
MARGDEKQMGGEFDWGRVTEQEMRNLSNDMFNAAGVPREMITDYWAWFERMKTKLSR